MRTSFRSIEPKGIEDYLKDLCLIYRGEMDNPHDVNAMLDEERAIQFLKYNLWDVERSILETPGTWRYLYIEEKAACLQMMRPLPARSMILQSRRSWRG